MRNSSLDGLTTHTSQADPFGFHKAAEEVWMEDASIHKTKNINRGQRAFITKFYFTALPGSGALAPLSGD
jgi:hypothetical protein